MVNIEFLRKYRYCAFMLAVICALTMLLALPTCALSEPPEAEHADAVFFYNVEQNRVMYEKNSQKEVYPTSTVKMMTGLLAIEMLSSRIDETVTVTEEMLEGVKGNNISLKAGERVTIKDMLYATICGGSNDSAAVLSYVAAGGVDEFVALMNDRAAAIGAEHTHYENVSGMHHDRMRTTAYDTFLIAKTAAENSLFLEISSAHKYAMPKTNKAEARNIYNKNMLISRYSETKYFNTLANGLNAGSTSQGGYCLATCAENDGQTYICVVMGAKEVGGTIYSYKVANDLIKWAYNSYGYVEVLTTDRLVCELPVTLSEDVDYVTLRPEKPLEVFLPLDINPEEDLTYSYKITTEKLEAPVAEGQAAGFITVSYGKEALGTVNLVALNNVERSEFLYGLKKLGDFSKSRVFIASVISLVILLVAYVFGTAFYRGRSRKRRYYR